MQREFRNLIMPAEWAQAVVLQEEGESYHRTDNRFVVFHATVSSIDEAQKQETGEHIRRAGQRRNRVTTPDQDVLWKDSPL